MNYQVILTDTAIQDLREIALWITDQTRDRDVAINFINALRSRCDKLRTFPDIGAFPKDHILKSMGYRFLTHKEYLIFYLTDDTNKTVHIVSVFNSKRDYMRVMRRFI